MAHASVSGNRRGVDRCLESWKVIDMWRAEIGAVLGLANGPGVIEASEGRWARGEKWKEGLEEA